MLIPAILAIGAVSTGGLVCLRGVTTESGTSPGGRWRIRWACWRWLAEKKVVGGSWERLGAYTMRQKGIAKTAAMTSVALPPGNIAAEPAMVRLIRAHSTPE